MRISIKKPFEDIFSEAALSPEIRRSIYFITMGNVFGTVWGIICNSGSATLTGFAQFLGAGDFVYGLLTAIPLAAAFLQIPFSALVRRTHKRKKYMMTYGLFSRAIWIVIGLIPFFVPAEHNQLRLWSAIFLIAISWSSSSFINICWMPWMADLIPIGIRGRWLSRRDGIQNFAGVTMGLLVARILDSMPGYTGYAIVFIMGGILGSLDMVCFYYVKEVYSTPPVKVKMLPEIKRIIQNKPFLKFTIFWTAWCFTANMSGAYYSRYAITEMGLSYMQFTLAASVTSSFVTVIMVSFWGKLLDKFGGKPVLWISCMAASVTPLFYLLSRHESIWPTLLYNVIGAAFWSGYNLAAVSLQLSASPDRERPTYIAFFSCVTSVVGAFLGILAGGAILEGIQSSVTLSAMIPDRYKFMFIIAVILRVGSVLIFIPRLENSSEHNVESVFKSIIGDISYWLKRQRIYWNIRYRLKKH